MNTLKRHDHWVIAGIIFVEMILYGGFLNAASVFTVPITEDLPGVTAVSGWKLIPQRETLYGDHVVHPNDEGFRWRFENLLKAAEPMIHKGECYEAKL